jgi:hypothetical protein
MKLSHELVEKNIGWMIVLTVLVVAVGGLVEIVPLYFQTSRRRRSPASGRTLRCNWLAAMSTSARAATTATRR